MKEKLSVSGEPVSGWAQCAAAVLGGALAATGAVAVFVTDNSVGAGSLVAAGAVIGVLGMFANKVQSVEGGGWKVELAAAAASTLKAAVVAEQQGRTDVAEALRDHAERLISAAEPIASKYEQMRRERPSGWDRTRELEGLVANQARLLAEAYPDTVSAERLFDTGTDGNRIIAIGIMEVKPTVASPRVAATAVRSPRSNYEQWHALKVIEAMVVRDPSSPDLTELRCVIERELHEGKVGGVGTDRRKLAERILALIGST